VKQRKIELESNHCEVLVDFINKLPRLERLTNYEYSSHYVPHMLTLAYFLKEDPLLIEALVESKFIDQYGKVDPVKSRMLVKWLLKDD